ncbi:MarR family winged helix-turn-helix transcriptional regulator [Rathayibacter soli]|uniref:MarR family winged helix-turn-helix transcriptional regulator n=1 Tax=Rathayibacter soli TaxID=3144168 RepID=UPI0027E40B2B|nr:MarR family transcriptional regulator [Glaciibacter superstes]
MERTGAGEVFTSFVVEVSVLGHFVTAAGEAIARHGGQTLARWVVLDAVAEQPQTVAQVGRLRGMARQPVQRVADLLVEEGLAEFSDNPQHRRAKLLALTARGRRVLDRINSYQAAWANEHGGRLGIARLENAHALITEIRPLVEMPSP